MDVDLLHESKRIGVAAIFANILRRYDLAPTNHLEAIFQQFWQSFCGPMGYSQLHQLPREPHEPLEALTLAHTLSKCTQARFGHSEGGKVQCNSQR